MKRLVVLALLTLVGGFFYLIHDVGRIPLYDANITRLAETPLEGYCAGQTFWRNNGEADAGRAVECRNSSERSDEVNLSQVVPQFCQAVVDEGFQGAKSDCENVVNDRRWWPTYDGGLTDAFTKAYPYPGDKVLTPPVNDDSRTGDREGLTRESNE